MNEERKSNNFFSLQWKERFYFYFSSPETSVELNFVEEELNVKLAFLSCWIRCHRRNESSEIVQNIQFFSHFTMELNTLIGFFLQLKC